MKESWQKNDTDFIETKEGRALEIEEYVRSNMLDKNKGMFLAEEIRSGKIDLTHVDHEMAKLFAEQLSTCKTLVNDPSLDETNKKKVAFLIEALSENEILVNEQKKQDAFKEYINKFPGYYTSIYSSLMISELESLVKLGFTKEEVVSHIEPIALDEFKKKFIDYYSGAHSDLIRSSLESLIKLGIEKNKITASIESTAINEFTKKVDTLSKRNHVSEINFVLLRDLKLLEDIGITKESLATSQAKEIVVSIIIKEFKENLKNDFISRIDENILVLEKIGLSHEDKISLFKPIVMPYFQEKIFEAMGSYESITRNAFKLLEKLDIPQNEFIASSKDIYLEKFKKFAAEKYPYTSTIRSKFKSLISSGIPKEELITAVKDIPKVETLLLELK